jgi:hypothetical protein
MTVTTEVVGSPPRVGVRWVPVAGLTVAVVVVLVIASTMVQFALPLDDDFVRAGRWGFGHTGLSWWRYVYDFVYLRWQGRWASCGLEAAVLPYVNPTRFYPALIAGLDVVDIACVWVVCRWATRSNSWAASARVTAVAVALLWAGLPSVAEGLHWFVGAVENTTSLALAAALTVCVATAADREAGTGVRCIITVAAFVVAGFHELYGGALCLALAIGWTTAGGRSARRTWAMALAGAGIGLAVVILAPGNRHRLELAGSAPHRSLAHALFVGGSLAWHHLIPWVLDPKLLAASAWVAVTPLLDEGRSVDRIPRGRAWLRWTVPVAGILAVVAGFVLLSYVFGGGGMPDRTVSGIWLMFVVAWMSTVYIWTRSPARHAMRTGRRNRQFAGISLIVLAAAMLTTGNLRRAASDLGGPARRWHAAMEARFDLLRSAGVHHAPVVVPPLPTAPQLFLSGETTDDPTDWLNFGLADYFGTGRLSLTPRPGTR